MADTVQTSYSAGYSETSKPDVLDMITNISPSDTVVCSAIGRTKATNKLHSYPVDKLEAPGKNAAVEGADIDAKDVAPPEMLNNVTQILTKAIRISDHREKEAKYGRKSEIKYQSANKLKELGTDLEWAVVNNKSKVLGDAGTAREMLGLSGAITSNVRNFGGTKAVSNLLTEDLLNDSMEDAWEVGGKLDLVVCPPSIKKAFASFDGYNTLTRNTDASAKKVVASINFYEGDFGDVAVKAHRYIEKETSGGNYYGSMFILDTDTWKKSFFQDIKKKHLGATGLSEKYLISMEATLEARAEQGNARIDNLFLKAV